MPKIGQIDEEPCQAEVRILQKITRKQARLTRIDISHAQEEYTRDVF